MYTFNYIIQQQMILTIAENHLRISYRDVGTHVNNVRNLKS